MTTVLRLYHSAVVDEYRERDRLLRSRHGFDMHLVCPPAWAEGGSLVRAPTNPDFPVHVVSARGRSHPILFWYAANELRRVIRDVEPDVVDLHEEPYSLAVAASLRAVAREAPRARVCVYTAQNIMKRYPPPFRQAERRALRRVEAAYPCSTEAGDVLRTKGYTGPLHVIPLGVAFDPGLAPRPGREELKVGFVARLEPYKGGHIAVRAFAEAARGLPARLEMVGSGMQEPELRATAQRLGIADRVDFPGPVPQDEALERIRDYDVLLVPSLTTKSWKEQFGRVVVQAMAAWTPVIASDCGSLPEVCGGAAAIVSEGDVAGFAAVLSGLLRDADRRAELAAAGRTHVREHHIWERVVDRCAEMYRDVTA